MIEVRTGFAQQSTAPVNQQVHASRDQVRDEVRHALHDARDGLREGLREGLRNGIRLQSNQRPVTVVQGAPGTAERPEQPELVEVPGTPGTPGTRGTPGTPGTLAPGDGLTTSNDFPPQIADISIAFFVMCTVIVIGWPIARALGRRLERRGQAPVVDAEMREQLQRIERAVDAMAIEVGRISEGQRFMAKLQNGAAVEGVALFAGDSR
jgi:hypothetical protein